jgi:hypothetical protein
MCGQVYLLDLICFGLIFLAFSLFGAYLQAQSAVLMNGMTLEQMQEFMATAMPEQLLPFTQALQSYLLMFVFGGILLLVGSLLFFSWCTALIWNHLQGKHLGRKTYWRWNLLHLAIILPMLGYALLVVVVKFIFNGVLRWLFTVSTTFYLAHESLLTSIATLVNGIVSFILMLLFLVWLFLVYYAFVEKYKVWSSIGEGFRQFRAQWSRLWRGMLWMLALSIILALLLMLIKKLPLLSWILILIQFLLSVAYFTWARKYVLQLMHI